jgi:hypothetical protein
MVRYLLLAPLLGYFEANNLKTVLLTDLEVQKQTERRRRYRP